MSGMADALKTAIEVAANALEEVAPELNRLDGFAGDGDMGVTMTAVAVALREVLAQPEQRDDSQLLVACGSALASKAPSTSGTLLATALLRAGKSLTVPVEEVTHTSLLSRAFAAALEGVQARGKAQVGDRTMVDALHAANASLAEAAEQGAPWPEALGRAAAAARRAVEASASMEPKAGRASWMSERALGHPDAGCEMVATVLEAVALQALAGT